MMAPVLVVKESFQYTPFRSRMSIISHYGEKTNLNTHSQSTPTNPISRPDYIKTKEKSGRLGCEPLTMKH
jgi:hypothetical protein